MSLLDLTFLQAKRGQDDRSRSSGIRPAAEAGHKRRRAGLPEPADTDVGTYSGEVYGHEMEHMEAHHMAKAQAVGVMPPQAPQQHYMYDMQHSMQPQPWSGVAQAYAQQQPHAAQHPHHMMGGVQPHHAQAMPARHMQDGDTPTGERQEDDSLYCLCQRPSFGNMIGCDGKDCPFEWFHQVCVNLPEGYEVQGKWYCPECRATPVDHGKQASQKVRKQRKVDREANRRPNGGPEFAHIAQQQSYHPQG